MEISILTKYMPSKDKDEKEKSFSETKNENPKMKVIDENELLPETKEIIPIKEFAKPLATVDEAKQAFKQYQELMSALMKESDIVEIQGKKRIKKTGINKVARFFGVSCEIIRQRREESIGPQGGKNFTWYVWTKCWLPNRQSRVDGGACSSNERRFTHLEHDVLSVAITRSSKRCIENLCGMGEYELIENEEENSEAPEPTPTKPEELASLDQIKMISELSTKQGTFDKLLEFIKGKYGVEQLGDLTSKQAIGILKSLRQKNYENPKDTQPSPEEMDEE
jgi:hypothetical protein